MAHVTKCLLVCVVGVCVGPLYILAQCRPSVNGKIVDESGIPVSSADVFLVEEEATISGNRYFGPFQTDLDGTFRASITVSGAGVFFVTASKESAGYPSRRLTFYNDREPQRFELDCDVSRSVTDFQLGPKAAFIQKISVLDAITGQPIPNASITLRRLTSPIKRLPVSVFFLTTSTVLLEPTSNYSGLPIPSNVDISYQISAPGYIASPASILHLRPGADFEISLKLQPVNGEPEK